MSKIRMVQNVQSERCSRYWWFVSEYILINQFNMKDRDYQPKRNGSSLSRRNSKGFYTDQYVGNKNFSADPIQQKLSVFVKAFQHICSKLENTIQKQNAKINIMEVGLIDVLGAKLDKIIAVGQRIYQGFEKSRYQTWGEINNNKFQQKPEIYMKDTGDKDSQKKKDSLKQSIISLNKNVFPEIQTKNPSRFMPPLPSLERCVSPSNSVRKNTLLSDEISSPRQLKTVELTSIKPISSNPNNLTSQSIVPFQLKQGSQIKKWVGQFYNSSASKYFELYSEGKLSYEDMKIKFSYDIINESLNIFRKWSQINKNKYNTIQFNRKRPQFYYILNQASNNCLQFLINKYPPSRRKRIDTELSNRIKDTYKKSSVAKYDMLRNGNTQIGYIQKQTDFTKEIKTWLNVLVKQTQSRFPEFKQHMRQIFINPDGSVDGFRSIDSELEFTIGSKISQAAQLFTQEELQAPGLQIKSTQLLRILMKWCQELSSYFTNPGQKIYGNTSGFKTIRGTLPIKIPKSRLDQLASKLKKIYVQEILPEFKIQSNNVGYLVTDLLSLTLEGIQNYEFLNQRQISIMKLSQYLNESLKSHVLKFLNLVLSKLIKVRSQYSDAKLQSNINLVTFNVMDLLRCRCVGSKNEIFRIFKKIQKSEHFEIIRVKNKLNEPTRDILINLKIKSSFLICEVQLSLGQAQEEVNDHFCHFLYELQRTDFGVLFESASQICNLDPRIQYVKRNKDIKFKGTTQKKTTLIQYINPSNVGPTCKCFHDEVVMESSPNNRPFCCSLCTGFQPGFTLCLQYFRCPVCFISICPQCVIMISMKFTDFIQSYTSKGSNFYDLIRFFYPKHLYEQVGDSRETSLKIPGLLQKYPYVLHMVVDNLGHKPVLYKRYKNSYTEAFSTLQNVNVTKQAPLCWNYVIALQPCQRKTLNELKNYKKYSINMEWFQLEEILKQNSITDVLVVIDKETGSALIADIIQSQQDIQKCKISNQVQKSINETNRLQSNFLQLTSKSLPDVTFFSKIINKNEVRVINLWQNKIKNIDILAQFHNVQELFLRENQIEDMNPILKMKQLESLFICDNKITGSLPILDFPNLTALDISLNHFNDMNNLTKSNMQNLVFFRMVHTKVTQIPVMKFPKLQVLWFDHNDISSLSNLVLSELPQLTKVSGTHNNISGPLQRLCFPKLQSLMLNYNQITSIEQINNSELPNLKTFVLHHNSISGPFPQIKLINLLKLDLSYNKITSLPGGIFTSSKLPKLETIDLKFNSISGNFPLIQLYNLRKLDASNNFINNIQLLGGSKIPSLQILDLSKNQIRNALPTLRFLRLRRLLISDNEIPDIQSLGDSKLPKLSILNLSNNKIGGSIPKMYFQNLRTIDFSSNMISSEQFLDHIHLLPSLQQMYLGNNPASLKQCISRIKDVGILQLLKFSQIQTQ